MFQIIIQLFTGIISQHKNLSDNFVQGVAKSNDTSNNAKCQRTLTRVSVLSLDPAKVLISSVN